MKEKKRSKMTRQLQLFYIIIHTHYHGPSDLIQELQINRRMLQRDLKDLRDSGLLSLKYDRTDKNYINTGEAVLNESAKARRKQHLIRLHRIGTLIRELSPTNMEELHNYESLLEDYEDFVRESFIDPVYYPPEDIPDKPTFDFPDLKSEYYALFPDSNERTRQRDFEEMTRAGFPIYYSRRHKAFIFEEDGGY